MRATHRSCHKVQQLLVPRHRPALCGLTTIAGAINRLAFCSGTPRLCGACSVACWPGGRRDGVGCVLLLLALLCCRFLPSLEVCVWQYMEQYAHRNVLAGQPCAAPPAHLSPGAAQGMRGVAGAGSVSRTPLASLPLLNNVSHAASGAAGGCKQGASAHLPGSARSGQHAAAGCGFAVCGVTTSSSGWTPVRHMR